MIFMIRHKTEQNFCQKINSVLSNVKLVSDFIILSAVPRVGSDEVHFERDYVHYFSHVYV